MGNKKNILTVVICLLSLIVGVLIKSGVAYGVGGNAGGTSGGGGYSGCGGVGWTMDTCYGATWKWYPTNSDSVTIPWYDNGYAEGGTITGCKEYGGYWRYALVAYASDRKITAGQQAGLLGIDSNNSSTYDSVWYGGGTNYIGTWDHWTKVKDFYNDLRDAEKKETGQNRIFKYYWGNDKADNLSWFCGGEIKKHTLTAYAIDTDGNALNKGKAISSAKGYAGTKVYVGLGSFKPKGYKFTGNWKYYNNKKDTWNDGGTNKFWTKSLSKDLKTYAVYEKVPNKLNVVGKNIYDNKNLTDGNKSTTGTGWVKMGAKSLTNKDSSNNYKDPSYKFIGWKTTASKGISGIIRRTQATVKGKTYKTYNDPTKSDNSYYNASGTALDVYGTIHANLASRDITVYAYYARRYNLKRIKGTGVKSITIAKSKTTYSNSAGAVNDGLKIYKDDYLAVNATLENGYQISECKVNNKIFKGECPNIHVTADTTIEVNAKKTTMVTLKIEPVIYETCGRYSGVSYSPISKEKGSDFGSVSAKSASNSEVEFVGWKTAKDGKCTTMNSTASSYVVGKLNANKTIYAVYKLPPNGDCSSNDGTFNQHFEGKTTQVVSRVRNSTLASPTSWVKSVYAKPDDDIDWIHCYYAGVQDESNEIVTQTHGTHNKYQPDGTITANINKEISKFGTWENSYSVASSASAGGVSVTTFTGSSLLKVGSFNIGKVVTKGYNSNYRVETGTSSKAGQTLTETITSGSPSSISFENKGIETWRCAKTCSTSKTVTCSGSSCTGAYSNEDNARTYSNCTTTNHPAEKDKKGKVIKAAYTDTTCTQTDYNYRCGTCKHSNDYIPSSRAGAVNDSASALVPLNFELSGSIELNDDIVYAGETTQLSNVTVIVSPRENVTLDGTYATKVPAGKAWVKVYTYLSDDESGENVLSDPGKKLAINWKNTSALNLINGSENLDGTEEDGGEKVLTGQDVGVHDVAAGNYFCVVAEIGPRGSNGDLDMATTSTGNEAAFITEPSCAVIAKRPSFQVWGSGISSTGNIKTATANKTNVRGTTDYYKANGSNTATIFGSFVELDILAAGNVAGLASGASTGYAGTITPDPFVNNPDGISVGGGAKALSYCVRSPLSFANSACSVGAVGSIGSKTRVKTKIESVKSKLSQLSGNTMASVTEVPSIESLPGQIGAGTFVVREENDDIVIDNNIVFEDNRMYTSLAEVPKVIIYAKNIYIDCAVNRIDAVLIADDTISTCGEEESIEIDEKGRNIIDDPYNSNQLVVNGSIITKKLLLGRTYGAGPGSNSIVPAEIINYDTSLFLWGAGKADVTGSGELTTSYQHEMAPRY